MEESSDRNYHPKDEDLRKHMLPPTPDYIQTMQAKFDILTRNDGDEELLSMAPKKPNWDLKRDIETNVEYLDRQTQIALANMLKAKVVADNNNNGKSLQEI